MLVLAAVAFAMLRAPFWQDFDAVAAASIDLLLAQITSGQRRGERPIIAPDLVSRESVGPPPRSRRRMV
jgi:DNA-binding LacI/PurR family transcriptional regulator